MAWAGGFSGVGLTRDEFRKWLRSQPKPPYVRIVNHMTDAPYTKASVPCNQRIRNLGNYYKNDLGTLGEIRSDLKHAVRWFDEHEAKDQERYDKLAARLDAADLTRSIVRLELVETEMREAAPVLESIKRAKWVLGGFVAAIGLVGGAIGGVATNAMKWFS